LDFSPDDIANFSAQQKSKSFFLMYLMILNTIIYTSCSVVFLELLGEYEAFSSGLLATMDKLYQFTGVRNAEIRFGWQMLCLKAAYTPIYDHVVAFVTEQGRMKYVRPLYRALNKVNADLARQTFLRNRDHYHPIAARMIEKDIMQS
jgi:hypothetical protein